MYTHTQDGESIVSPDACITLMRKSDEYRKKKKKKKA